MNKIITKEQIEQLIRIYNTFFEISTKGQDTLIMADCLRELGQIINIINSSSDINIEEKE